MLLELCSFRRSLRRGTGPCPCPPFTIIRTPLHFRSRFIRTYHLALIGFGNVGRSFVGLIQRKRDDLRERYGIDYRITGIATRRLGWLTCPTGFTTERILTGNFSEATSVNGLDAWIAQSNPHALFEASSLNAETGEPATTHIRAALEHGAHAISANKGPVVHAWSELTELAQSKGLHFYHESAMMDGAPVFSLFREALPAIEILGFRGVLNSTTNVILERMEAGGTFEEAVREAQRLGVAETDPTDDVEGIDAAVKIVGLVNVLMRGHLKLRDISRQGIRGVTAEQLREARAAGETYKLVCRARRQPDGRITASVAPARLKPDDPLFAVRGTSLSIGFETDIFKELSVTERDPGPEATAYGMLSDFINAVRST